MNAASAIRAGRCPLPALARKPRHTLAAVEANAAIAAPVRARSGTSGSALRLTCVTDIMTPYMVTQFEALARQSRLHVVFCSQTGSRAMPWDLASGLSFSHDVIGGLVLPGH